MELVDCSRAVFLIFKTMQLPTLNPQGLPFGSTKPPYSANDPHKGVDFDSVPDRTIYMPEDGVVQCVVWNGDTREGNVIYINFPDRRHALCHMSRFLVANGAFVKRGTPVGIMGDTGYAFGVHLHWALRLNGQLVDPIKQVNEAFIGGNEMPTPDEVNIQFQAVFNREANADEVAYWTQRTWNEFANWCLKNSVDQRTKASEFDKVNEALKRSDAEVERLRKELTTTYELINEPVYRKKV